MKTFRFLFVTFCLLHLFGCGSEEVWPSTPQSGQTQLAFEQISYTTSQCPLDNPSLRVYNNLSPQELECPESLIISKYTKSCLGMEESFYWDVIFSQSDQDSGLEEYINWSLDYWCEPALYLYPQTEGFCDRLDDTEVRFMAITAIVRLLKESYLDPICDADLLPEDIRFRVMFVLFALQTESDYLNFLTLYRLEFCPSVSSG